MLQQNQAITDKEYRANSAISHSDLNLVKRGLDYYQYQKEYERKVNAGIYEPELKDYYIFGSLLNDLILRPEIVDSTYKVFPKIDKRTKEGKEAAKEITESVLMGLLPVDETEYKKALNIISKLKENRLYNKYLSCSSEPGIDVFNEAIIFWNFLDFPCKSKLDKFIVNHIDKEIYLIDFKHTSKYVEEPYDFIFEYGYDRQLAFYKEAIKYTQGKEFIANYPIKCYLFIVSSLQPYSCRMIQICEEKLNTAWLKEQKYFNKLKIAIESGSWLEPDLETILKI